jgi:hypothetical protein
MRQVTTLFTPHTPAPGADGTTLIAFRTAQPLETVLPASQQLLGPEAE